MVEVHCRVKKGFVKELKRGGQNQKRKKDKKGGRSRQSVVTIGGAR